MRMLAIFVIFASIAAAQDPAPLTLEERLKKAGAEGKSIETGEDLAEAPEEGDRVESRKIKLSGADISTPMVLSETGSTLYLADRTGYVRKIILPEWLETRRLWIGKPVTGLAKCKEGLLATIAATKQMILIKEDILSVTYHWSMDEATSVVAMPHGGPAWISKTVSGFQTELQVIDMATHGMQPTIVALEMMKRQGSADSYKRSGSSKQLSTFENLIAAPRGDFLLCSSSNCLFRLVSKGFVLQVEEAGPPLGHFKHIAISDDGNWVAAPGPEPAYAGWPSCKGGGSLIFKTKDLQKPTAGVDELDVWGFTPSAEKVFGIKAPRTLVVQTLKGKVDRTFDLGAAGGEVLGLKRAGDGTKYIIHMEDRILWVSFK